MDCACQFERGCSVCKRFAVVGSGGRFELEICRSGGRRGQACLNDWKFLAAIGPSYSIAPISKRRIHPYLQIFLISLGCLVRFAAVAVLLFRATA